MRTKFLAHPQSGAIRLFYVLGISNNDIIFKVSNVFQWSLSSLVYKRGAKHFGIHMRVGNGVDFK